MGDIDERRNRIVIGVATDAAKASVTAALEPLALPDDLVIIERFEGVMPLASSTSLQSTYRPVLAGLKVQSALNCTLGYNARRMVNGQFDGYWYFLTNSHCTSAFGSPTGPDAGQATTLSLIGSEVADPPTFTNTQNPSCPSGKDCRYSDASLFRYNAGVSLTFAAVAYPSLGNTTFTSTKWVGGSVATYAGLTVQKVGQETGRTSGTISNTCATLNVQGTNRTMLCQGLVSAYADFGDSGSPVVWEGGDGKLYVAGMLFGVQVGAFAYSPEEQYRSEIAQAYGGTVGMWISGAPDPTVVITGPDLLPPGLLCTWTATGSGGVPPYSYSWSGLFTGDGPEVSRIVNSSGWIYVHVDDLAGHGSQSSLYVTVSTGAQAPPGCTE